MRWRISHHRHDPRQIDLIVHDVGQHLLLVCIATAPFADDVNAGRDQRVRVELAGRDLAPEPAVQDRRVVAETDFVGADPGRVRGRRRFRLGSIYARSWHCGVVV